MTYIEKIDNWLKEINEELCVFVSEIKIKSYSNDPSSSVIAIISPYCFDKSINDDQKKQQMKINKSFNDWINHFTQFKEKLSNDNKKEIDDSLEYIDKQINLESSWETESTSAKNVDALNKRFNVIYECIKLFKGEKCVVLVPDTNALIKESNFDKYKKLAGDKITILLLPTVLSELDKLKMDYRNEGVREKAKSMIKQLKGYRNQGNLEDGVIVYKTIKIKRITIEPDFKKTLSYLDKSNNDDKIIASLLEYQVENPSYKVCLVTLDFNLQNKAEFTKISYCEI